MPRLALEQCPHRHCVSHDDLERAECRLVGALVGLVGSEGYEVGRDACEACCRFGPVTIDRMNPALASLVFDAASTMLVRAGASRFDRTTLNQVRSRALVELGVCLPAEPTPPRAAAAPPSNRTPARFGRVGLVGWNTATGLGSMNRDLAGSGLIDRWLIPRHPRFPPLADVPAGCRVDHVPATGGPSDSARWLEGLDWVLFVEIPYLDRFAQRAKEAGVRLACVPMWEMTNLAWDWLRDVDLMICPNRWCYERFSAWKARYGFAWDVAHLPWPVDVRTFRFRKRSRCRKYLFINGTGGSPARRLDGTPVPFGRKGLSVVLDAARLVPRIPVLIHSQVPVRGPLPPNVELRPALPRREALYRDGDVCIQPSHWEGLGLQLLECQAAGMPLITTDAPPMNEFRPLRALSAEQSEVISVNGNEPVTAHLVAPGVLAEALAQLHGADIRAASREARALIEREHSWREAARRLRGLLIG
jgi:glycosyltransferase involved in cell wall biosynthesis